MGAFGAGLAQGLGSGVKEAIERRDKKEYQDALIEQAKLHGKLMEAQARASITKENLLSWAKSEAERGMTQPAAPGQVGPTVAQGAPGQITPRNIYQGMLKKELGIEPDELTSFDVGGHRVFAKKSTGEPIGFYEGGSKIEYRQGVGDKGQIVWIPTETPPGPLPQGIPRLGGVGPTQFPGTSQGSPQVPSATSPAAMPQVPSPLLDRGQTKPQTGLGATPRLPQLGAVGPGGIITGGVPPTEVPEKIPDTARKDIGEVNNIINNIEVAKNLVKPEYLGVRGTGKSISNWATGFDPTGGKIVKGDPGYESFSKAFGGIQLERIHSYAGSAQTRQEMVRVTATFPRMFGNIELFKAGAEGLQALLSASAYEKARAQYLPTSQLYKEADAKAKFYMNQYKKNFEPKLILLERGYTQNAEGQWVK